MHIKKDMVDPNARRREESSPEAVKLMLEALGMYQGYLNDRQSSSSSAVERQEIAEHLSLIDSATTRLNRSLSAEKNGIVYVRITREEASVTLKAVEYMQKVS